MWHLLLVVIHTPRHPSLPRKIWFYLLVYYLLLMFLRFLPLLPPPLLLVVHDIYVPDVVWLLFTHSSHKMCADSLSLCNNIIINSSPANVANGKHALGTHFLSVGLGHKLGHCLLTLLTGPGSFQHYLRAVGKWERKGRWMWGLTLLILVNNEQSKTCTWMCPDAFNGYYPIGDGLNTSKYLEVVSFILNINGTIPKEIKILNRQTDNHNACAWWYIKPHLSESHYFYRIFVLLRRNAELNFNLNLNLIGKIYWYATFNFHLRIEIILIMNPASTPYTISKY